MVRPAPATVRTIAVLNFFAAHPGDVFTLSELSAVLGVNMASLLAILQGLMDAGYVVRHPRHKTYALGPSLVALGHAALARHPAIDAARAAMRPLADELGTELVASVVIGDEIVIVATAGVAPAEARDVRVGQRIPIVPPLAAIFYAWSPPATVEHWLALTGAGAPAERDRHLGLLAAVRERGYSVGLETGARAELGATLERLADAPVDAALRERLSAVAGDLGLDYVGMDLEPDARYHVSTVAAPVFGPGGEVAVALTANGLGGNPTGAEVAAVAARLMATARSVTKVAHGRVPAGTERALVP